MIVGVGNEDIDWRHDLLQIKPINMIQGIIIIVNHV